MFLHTFRLEFADVPGSVGAAVERTPENDAIECSDAGGIDRVNESDRTKTREPLEPEDNFTRVDVPLSRELRKILASADPVDAANAERLQAWL